MWTCPGRGHRSFAGSFATAGHARMRQRGVEAPSFRHPPNVFLSLWHGVNGRIGIGSRPWQAVACPTPHDAGQSPGIDVQQVPGRPVLAALPRSRSGRMRTVGKKSG